MRPIRLARLEAERGEAQSLCFAPPRRRRPCSSSAATAAARALATGRRQRASSAFRSSPFLIHLASNLDSPKSRWTRNRTLKSFYQVQSSESTPTQEHQKQFVTLLASFQQLSI